MEKIYESGRAKAIGVSNFSIKKYGWLLSCCLHFVLIRASSLEKLFETAKVVPAVNQVECVIQLVTSTMANASHGGQDAPVPRAAGPEGLL